VDAVVRRHLDSGRRAAPAALDASVALEDLGVSFDGRSAIAGVTGTMMAGEATAIVGPNGAGKSTLLRAIASVVQPDRGRVVLRPEEASLAFLEQRDAVDRDYPIQVLEFVAIGAWRSFGALDEVSGALRGTALDALGMVGLAALADRPIAALSVGQFQRACFARLVLQAPSVVLLDEPLAAVDADTITILLDMIGQWRREGRVVIAAMHDLGLVRQHFTKTLLLFREPIAWGESAAVLSDANLNDARRRAFG
jgi:zinc/manganese transport system ATP-binding protein